MPGPSRATEPEGAGASGASGPAADQRSGATERSVGRLGRWLAELANVSTGLVEAQLPGRGGIDARTREALIRTVGEANGSRVVEWIHGGWQAFLGDASVDEDTEPLFAYARACAEAGEPVDPTPLSAMFEPPVVRSTRATVARAEIGSFVEQAALDMVVPGRRPGVVGRAVDVVAVAAALPMFAVVGTAGGALRLAAHLAPALPEPQLPPDEEASLVVHLLADAVPTYLANALVRAVLVWNPVVLAVGVRVQGTDATLRVGQGRVEIVNGLRPDALVVVEGGLDPLLRLAAASILQQLRPTRSADRSA